MDYRKNVGIVVFNSSGKLLVGERVQFPNAWQFPQGGIDAGENPEKAWKRELYEEVGIDSAIPIGEYPDWIRYDFPKDFRLQGNLKNFVGQIQKWFLVFWDHEASECKLDIHEIEFSRVDFKTWTEILESIVEFKKETYLKLEKEFKPLIHSYLTNLESFQKGT